MKRDGKNKSLWQDVDFTPSEINVTPSIYDVVIVGGGMTGVVTALTLQKSGKSCLLVESHNLGYGTTGGTTAHLNTVLDTPYTTITSNFGKDASMQVANATKDAINTIENNVREYSIPCEFRRTSSYLFSQEEKETRDLDKIREASQQAGIDVALENELPINTSFEKILKVNGQAQFHPLKYLIALAAEFEKSGGHILTGCMVKEVKEEKDILTAITTRGDWNTKKIVFATHIPMGINLLHLRCAPWRSYAIAVKLEDNAYPDGLIYDMKDPYHYYRSHHIDGEDYLIVGGEDHKTGEFENTDTPFLKLRAHVAGLFNVKEITHQWSSQYFEPTDGLAYIGHLPVHNKNYLVATGFSGNGMIYSHIAAKEITSLIHHGSGLYNDVFSPSRIKPVAGFKNFISHNTDVVKHLVEKYFGVEHLDAFAEIAPGEGKVVEIEGTLVALSKGHAGDLNAVSPVCTHMKCSVAWNSTEQSWDCPCHGARFAPNGKVLTGPASRDLEPVNLPDPSK